MSKQIVQGEITAEQLQEYLDQGLVSIKRSGTGIRLTFKKEVK